MPGERGVGLRLDVHARARGHVVEDNRLFARVRNGGEHSDQPLLRRLIVIGRHDEAGVRPHRARVLCQLDGVLRVVAARPRDDGDSSVCPLHDEGDRVAVFVVRKRGGLPRRPADDERVDPRFDLPVDQEPEAMIIDGSVRRKRRDQRGCRALKNSLLHSFSFSPNLSDSRSF